MIKQMMFELSLRDGPLLLHPSPTPGYEPYTDDHSALIDDLDLLRTQYTVTRAITFGVVAIIGYSLITLWPKEAYGALSVIVLAGVPYIPDRRAQNFFWWTKSARRLTPYFEHVETIADSLWLYPDQSDLWKVRTDYEFEKVRCLIPERMYELNLPEPKKPTLYQRFEYWMTKRERDRMIAAQEYFFPTTESAR